jgi:hypothetical protein
VSQRRRLEITDCQTPNSLRALDHRRWPGLVTCTVNVSRSSVSRSRLARKAGLWTADAGRLAGLLVRPHDRVLRGPSAGARLPASVSRRRYTSHSGPFPKSFDVAAVTARWRCLWRHPSGIAKRSEAKREAGHVRGWNSRVKARTSLSRNSSSALS